MYNDDMKQERGIIMTDIKELFGKTLFHTRMNRIALIDEIGRRNNVGRGTVYGWLKTDDPVSRGRLKATLETLIAESNKGA